MPWNGVRRQRQPVATLPSEKYLRQSCLFLDIPYDRDQIIRDRCWTVFQMRRRKQMLEREERRVR